jgi:acetyl-CoA acetyltransferase
MGRKVFVGNLSFSAGEAELRQLFEQKGNVEAVTVMRDNDTGRSRGFAFVEMASEEAAQKRRLQGRIWRPAARTALVTLSGQASLMSRTGAP